MSAIETLPAPELCFAAPVDDKWERERRAFVRMLPELLVTHRDQFVAVHQGQVVASGPDKISVALQAFFEGADAAAQFAGNFANSPNAEQDDDDQQDND